MSLKKQNLIFLKNKFISYIRSFRLSFWFLISVFFLLGEWYSKQFFPRILSIIALLALLGIFSAGSMINNAFDKKLDIFARKPIVKVFEYISPKEMLFSSALVSIVSLVILYWFINIQVFLLGLIIVIIGILYSTPPIMLKTRPPFDCIMNAIGGTIPFFMGWVITGNSLTSESLFCGLVIGLIILHTYFLFTTIDIDMDKEMGVATSCNMLGRKNSIITGIIIYIIDLFISTYFLGVDSLITISLFVYIPFMFIVLIVINNRRYLSIMVGGRCISFFAGSLLILLSISTKNIFPIFFLIIWIFLTSIDLIGLLKIRKITNT